MSKIVSMTTLDSEALKVGSDTILLVVDQTSERKVLVDDGGAKAKQYLVSDSLAAIITEAGNLYQVTSTGLDVALAAGRTAALVAEGSGSKVFYSGKGADLDQYITDEDPATIEAAIDAL